MDARIPQVSRNPDMDEIAAGKPRMMILNRIDLSDPNMTAVWAKHFREQGMAVIQTDSRSGNGTQAFSGAVRTLLADKIALWNIVTTVDAYLGAGFPPAQILESIHPSLVASAQGTGFGGMMSMRKL